MIYKKCECGRDKKYTCSTCLNDCCKVCKCDHGYKKEESPFDIITNLSKPENVIKGVDISDERELLKMTAELWNKFVSLEKFHPDENNDFADGIHNLQKMISYRITAKEHPEIFPRKVKEGD